MSCSGLGNLWKVSALVLSLLAMACSTTGGGAAAPTVGGVDGAPCSVDYHNEGCNNLPGPPVQRNRMQCTAGASGAAWKLKQTCGDSQVCVEKPDPAAGGTAKKVTECVTISQPAGPDTIGGNDTTSSGNDTTSNPGDIKEPTPKEAVACIQSKCASQYAACMAKPACAGPVACVAKCNDGPCADACTKADATSSEFIALVTCGMDKACIPKEGATKCGNNVCESGESMSNCPIDCKSTGPSCGNNVCESGETTTSCPNDCKTTGPKCGNGVCESGENIEMCPSDCKTTGPKCGNGQCESGETASSCPSDCGSGPKCGDLSCNSPETASTCPLDCDPKSQQMLSCAMEMCPQTSQCASDPACMNAVNCILKCGTISPDSSCTSMCMSGLPSGTMSTVGSLLSCVSSKCGATSPQCGNGTCESGETASNCPSDCGSSTGSCGDKVCANGEQSTCPSDCTNFGKSGGCVADPNKGKGCLGCLCEQCVCKVGNPATGTGPDDYCCSTAWDDQCAKECSACSGSGCSAP